MTGYRSDPGGFEAGVWRQPPSTPYVPGNARLIVPSGLITQMYAFFSGYLGEGVEAGCFIYGSREGTVARASALVVPTQVNFPGHYHVDADAVERVAAATRPHGWKNIAQVHSHPGRWVEHSPYDDQNAVSRRSLSIVVPNYGARRRPWPEGVGVHEFQRDYWYLLEPEAAAQRIVVASTSAVAVVDLR